MPQNLRTARLGREFCVVLLAVFLGCTGAQGTPGAAEAIPGFAAMEHPELLPLFPPNGTLTKQFNCYDTSGGNDDGVWGAWLRYVDEHGEWVIFDEVGPGCLYRQQMNIWISIANKRLPRDLRTRIKYYFDGEATPRIDMPISRLFGYKQQFTPPFTPPLAFFDTNFDHPALYSDRFANSYYPFPFAKRLKITITPKTKAFKWNKWFQYTYLKYPAGTKVQTWSGMGSDSPVVRKQWEHLGEDPKDARGNVEVARDLEIPDKASVTALELTGQGSIASLQFVLTPYSPQTLYKTYLSIYWDDQAKAAVELPLGRFFGAGGTGFYSTTDSWKKSFNSLFLGFDSKTHSMYSYWPMPYWSKARVVITNRSGTDITSLKVRAEYKPASALDYPRAQAGYFHARQTVDISPPNTPYSTIFTQEGRGKVVGTFFDSEGYACDGDEFTYFDDSKTPQIHGSGTEDDHDQGWGGAAYQKPLWGGMVDGYTAAYRYYMNDSYLFNRNIRITFEHTDAYGNRFGQKTNAVAFCYLAPEGVTNLKLSDEVDVGNTAAEKAHAYNVTGQTWEGSIGCCYDVYEQARKFNFVKDDGRAFTGASQFTVQIDPANQGVMLRRRCNRHMAQHQVAEVYVDGVKASEFPWSVCELTTPDITGWTDSDYFIPAALTAGKKQITIKVQCVDSSNTQQGINEFYYWVYCYGPCSAGVSNGRR